MQVELGKEGLKKSWQGAFKEAVDCVHCGAKSRIGFVAHENYKDELGGPFVCNLHKNEKDKMWLHDCCCVAVYFCTSCLFPTAKYNQA